MLSVLSILVKNLYWVQPHTLRLVCKDWTVPDFNYILGQHYSSKLFTEDIPPFIFELIIKFPRTIKCHAGRTPIEVLSTKPVVLKNLETLFLKEIYITDISALKYVHNLSLTDCKIEDISVLGSRCGDIPGVQYLTCQASRIKNLRNLYDQCVCGKCDFIKSINLNLATGINNIDLKALRNIKRIILSNTCIFNIEYLNRCTCEGVCQNNCNIIEYLDLEWTDIINITPLKNFHKLEYLNISHTNVFDVSPLKLVRSLKLLNLLFTKVSDISEITAEKILFDNRYIKIPSYITHILV
jgi:Leucine-rich repeat (LRR) protein